jgi:hypothetical protein
MQRQIDLGLVIFREDHTEPPIRKAHLIPVPDLDESNQDLSADNEDVDDEDAGLLVMPSVIHRQAQASVKLLRSIFQGKKIFENPKDHEIIARLIGYVTDPTDLILDSFAGSGTTGHAVLNLNKQDGGNRRFILVEIEPHIARNVTAERVRRVAEGYTNAKGERVEGLGSGFRYCKLGEPLFDERGKIRDTVSFADLARHVYFTETGEPLPREPVPDTPWLGAHRGIGIYLLYNGILGDASEDGGNVLTRAVLDRLPPFAGPKIIYCAGCLLGPDRLRVDRILHVRQTPYEIKVS